MQTCYERHDGVVELLQKRTTEQVQPRQVAPIASDVTHFVAREERAHRFLRRLDTLRNFLPETVSLDVHGQRRICLLLAEAIDVVHLGHENREMAHKIPSKLNKSIFYQLSLLQRHLCRVTPRSNKTLATALGTL
jgi:hypothetical protein